MKTQVSKLSPISLAGIPTDLSPATAAAYAAVGVAIGILVKEHGKLSKTVRKAYELALNDPAYMIAKGAEGSATLRDQDRIARDLVSLVSDEFVKARAAVALASSKVKHESAKARNKFEREGMTTAFSAVRHANRVILDIVFGDDHGKLIKLDADTDRYMLSDAPAKSEGNAESKGNGESKGNAKSKGNAESEGNGESKGNAESKGKRAGPEKALYDALDNAPGCIVAALKDGRISAALRIAFGDAPDEVRAAIIANMCEIEGACAMLKTRVRGK